MKKNRQRLILAIDTSCDDTSAAVVCGREVWSNVVASQTELHKPYGGVFPTVAKQAHKENIAPVVSTALKRAGVTFAQLEAIAVTIGPGLAPALEVGMAYAQALAKKYHLPLIPVNHLEGHLLSVLAHPKSRGERSQHVPKKQVTDAQVSPIDSPALPVLGMVVSGRNTLFVRIELATQSAAQQTNLKQPPTDTIHDDPTDGEATSHQQTTLGSAFDRQPRLQLAPDKDNDQLPWLTSGQFTYTILGQSVDDAAGECLDKVGRMLNLGYPAGPVVEELAKLGDLSKYAFPLPMTSSGDYNVSFSGLKTFSRRLIEAEWGSNPPTKQNTYDFCASLQYAVFRHICHKLNKILLDFPELTQVWLGGGVAANMTLRKMIRQTVRETRNKSMQREGGTAVDNGTSVIDGKKSGASEIMSGAHRRSSEAYGKTNMTHSTNGQVSKLSIKPLLVPYTKRLCMDNAAMVGVTVRY